VDMSSGTGTPGGPPVGTTAPVQAGVGAGAPSGTDSGAPQSAPESTEEPDDAAELRSAVKMAKARIADLDKALAESNASAAAMRAEKDAALKGLASLDPSRNPNPVPSGVPGGVPTMAASASADTVPAWMPALMAHLDARIDAKVETKVGVKKEAMLAAAAFAAGSTRKTSEMMSLKEELFGAVQDSLRTAGASGGGGSGHGHGHGHGGTSIGAGSAKHDLKRSRDGSQDDADYAAFAAGLFKPQRVEAAVPLFTRPDEFTEPMTVTFSAANAAAPPAGLDSLGSFPLAGDVLAPMNSFDLLGPMDPAHTELLYRLVPSARPRRRA